jgi:hypothetical protein
MTLLLSPFVSHVPRTTLKSSYAIHQLNDIAEISHRIYTGSQASPAFSKQHLRHHIDSLLRIIVVISGIVVVTTIVIEGRDCDNLIIYLGMYLHGELIITCSICTAHPLLTKMVVSHTYEEPACLNLAIVGG